MGLLKIVSQFVPVVRPVAMVGAYDGFRRSILKKTRKEQCFGSYILSKIIMAIILLIQTILKLLSRYEKSMGVHCSMFIDTPNQTRFLRSAVWNKKTICTRKTIFLVIFHCVGPTRLL